MAARKLYQFTEHTLDMKAIVIGGSGFIGSNVAMSLDAEKVVYYSRHENEVLNKKGVEHITGSVVETEKLQEAVKQFDMIVYSAGIFNDPQQTHDDVTLKGIKAVVDVIRKQDTGQKLIFFSAINTDYGSSEYFRLRRITEDNVNLAKESLTIKLSNIFGEGDRITGEVLKIARSPIHKMPAGKSLAPVSISDLVKVLQSFLTYKGTIYVCSKEDISISSAVNIARNIIGGRPAKGVENKRKIPKLVSKMAEKVDIPDWRLMDLTLNYYRENTSLYRSVKDPMKFVDYLKEKAKA